MDAEALNRLLALNLETLIEEKGLNPSRLAKDANLNHTAVRDILGGKVKNPTYRTLVNIAEAAGVDIRRITVGPDYEATDRDNAEIVDLLLQLEPSERRFLLNAAKAQIAARGSHSKPTGEDPE